MSFFKRFLLLGSLSMVLLTGLLFTSHTLVPHTASASGCNTTAIGLWKNNCQTSEGNISNFVYAIQLAIDESGSNCYAKPDGDFGPQTFVAVECFQTAKHLSIDGIVGPQTWGALYHTLISFGSSGGWNYYAGPGPRIPEFFPFRQSTSSAKWEVNESPSSMTSHWCWMNLSPLC